MKSKIASIRLLIIGLLVLRATGITAQGMPVIHTDSIVALEQKFFTDARVSNGPSGNERVMGTVASANFDVSYYRCEWEINPDVRFIKGKITSYFTITTATDNIIFDLSDTLTVDSVTYRGQKIFFQKISGDGLQLQFPTTISAGQKDSLSVYYNGVPRILPGFRPFVQTSHSGVPVIWTLSEPFGAKEWWPCKNGLNDKADSLDILITSPLQYRASSNGILVAEDSTALSRTLYFKHRYPIASYLLGVAVTNYVVIKDSVLIGNHQMPLMLTTYPEFAGNASKINTNAKNAFLVLNDKLGNYPFEKEQYGQTAWSAGGGMEHQTNSFIATTDIGLITHELGHQWFGDKITCGSWRDVWLNEGFATYCLSLYYENTDKNIFYLERKYYLNNITSLPDGSVWVNDTTSAARIFDGRLSYNKGSYLLHMLRWKLGDDVFFRGIRRYINDPLLKYNYAKTADLQRNLEQESGQNLSVFFQNWFYGQGYPTYAVEWKQDSSNNIFVKINQSVSHPSVSFYDMPVPIQFKNNNRDTIIVFDHIQNGQTFLATPGFKADTAIFDPYYWILCRSSTQHTACSGISATDKLFPFYNITWFQNANNWSFVTVNQINSAASSLAENIPLYLHFSGNGKDTSFEIKDIKYSFNNWLNIGFRATNVFVSTSCLMDGNYSLSNQNNNSGPNEIKIFPVPVTGSAVNISLKNPSDKHLFIRLYNATGQLIFQKTSDTPGRDELFTIPVNNLAKGAYFIKLESESTIKTTRKIIK